MTADDERRAFNRRYANESVTVTVLTGESTGGASQVAPDELWTRHVDLLAWAGEDGVHPDHHGRLAWLVTAEERRTGTVDLAPLSQYEVRVRRAAPDPEEYRRHGFTTIPDLSGSFALDEVVGTAELPELEDHRRRWLAPHVVSTDVGVFELRRRLRYFVGVVAWVEGQVKAELDVDHGAAPGAETCDAALTRLREHLAEAAALDARWRGLAAAELVELARDWQQGGDDSPVAALTEESFARRLTLDSIGVMADGGTLLTYDDGDLFLGHVVQVELDPHGALVDAQIAG